MIIGHRPLNNFVLIILLSQKFFVSLQAIPCALSSVSFCSIKKTTKENCPDVLLCEFIFTKIGSLGSTLIGSRTLSVVVKMKRITA